MATPETSITYRHRREEGIAPRPQGHFRQALRRPDTALDRGQVHRRRVERVGGGRARRVGARVGGGAGQARRIVLVVVEGPGGVELSMSIVVSSEIVVPVSNARAHLSLVPGGVVDIEQGRGACSDHIRHGLHS